MSWTSYVEKSGSGTGEILAKCAAHGLAAPEFDPAVGTFRTVIWRSGYGPKGRRGNGLGPKSGAQVGRVGPAVIPVYERVLDALLSDERSSGEVATAIGQKSLSGKLKQRIKAMLDDGVVEYTIPETPRSRFQKYRLTAKGRALASSLGRKRKG